MEEFLPYCPCSLMKREGEREWVCVLDEHDDDRHYFVHAVAEAS